MPLVYDCTVQLPCAETELDVGAGPVPLEPPELLPPLLDPLEEPLPEAPLDDAPPASSPPELEVPTPELLVSKPELDPVPELDPLYPLELLDPDPPLLPPPLEPRFGPFEPPDVPPPQAPMARHGPRSHVAVERRMVMVVLLSPLPSLRPGY
jgi:hypothetical protein